MKHRCETVHDGNICIYCGDYVDIFPGETNSEIEQLKDKHLNSVKRVESEKKFKAKGKQ